MTTTYSKLGEIIGAHCDDRNRTYGSSFSKTADYLRTLFPDGIKPDQYVHLGLLVRIFDKAMRIATGHYDDSYSDIVGYGLLGEKMVREQAGARVVENGPAMFTSTPTVEPQVTFVNSSGEPEALAEAVVFGLEGTRYQCLLCDSDSFVTRDSLRNHQALFHGRLGGDDDDGYADRAVGY